MAFTEHLHNLMSQIGPQLDLAEVTEFADDDLWMLIFDDDFRIEAGYVEDHDRLYLSTSLGRPAPDRELEIYKTLLQYNYLWEQTGGARMALDAEDGEITLVVDLPSDLELPEFQIYLENLKTVSLRWKDFLSGTIEVRPDAPADDGFMFNALRV